MNDRPSLNAVLAARDLAHVWHPCTQMREHDGALPLIPIVRGEGAFLVDADGRRYFDGISSWWSNLFGHANPRIAAAISRAACTAGNRRAINTAMIAITTRSSISVKPRNRLRMRGACARPAAARRRITSWRLPNC